MRGAHRAREHGAADSARGCVVGVRGSACGVQRPVRATCGRGECQTPRCTKRHLMRPRAPPAFAGHVLHSRGTFCTRGAGPALAGHVLHSPGTLPHRPCTPARRAYLARRSRRVCEGGGRCDAVPVVRACTAATTPPGWVVGAVRCSPAGGCNTTRDRGAYSPLVAPANIAPVHLPPRRYTSRRGRAPPARGGYLARRSRRVRGGHGPCARCPSCARARCRGVRWPRRRVGVLTGRRV